jgi:hypothetical protein
MKSLHDRSCVSSSLYLPSRQGGKTIHEYWKNKNDSELKFEIKEYYSESGINETPNRKY